MASPEPPTPPSDAETAREMAGQRVEPFLPAERWLVIGSITLGVVLLAVLLWVTNRYFPTRPPVEAAALLRLNNVGVGQMEQFDYPAATATFEKVVAIDPTWTPGRVNLGIALLNVATPASLDRAVGIFNDILKSEPNNPHAHYCLGMILLHRNDLAGAYPHFEAVSRVDPKDAHTWYHMGRTNPQGPDSPVTKECFEKALQLNPYLNAARYALAMHPHERDEKTALALLNEQRALVDATWETQYEIAYSRMGKYADVIGRPEAPKQPPPFGPLPMFATDPPLTVKLAPGTRWATHDDLARSPAGPRPELQTAPHDGALILLDFDADRRPDVLLLRAAIEGGKLRDVLLHNDGSNSFTDVSTAAGLASDAVSLSACAGDFDNDGRTDLFVGCIGRHRLLRNTGGKFEDVTASAGLASLLGSGVACGWVDADQDADLDLFAVLKPTDNSGKLDALQLWLNVGVAPPTPANAPPAPLSAKFARFDKLPPLPVGFEPWHVAFTDLDGDKDVDVVVPGVGRPRALLNDRLLRFRLTDPLRSPADAVWSAALAADLDHDSRSEVLFLSQDGSTFVTQSQSGEPATQPVRLRQAIALDVDLDGWTDVAGLTDAGKPTLLHNEAGKLTHLAEAFGTLDSFPKCVAVSATDLDGDCAPDLLMWSEQGLTWRRNLGNGNRAVRVELSGRRDKGSDLRTNADGVGAWAIAQAGSLWTGVENVTLSAGPGQSRLPLTLGVGKATQVDVLRVRWPDAVPQAELNQPTCDLIRLLELNRKGTSCPVLSVWDGTRFAYITDLLGGGALGEMLPDGSLRSPRAEESVGIDGAAFKPKDGAFVLKLAEPMDEVMYLDRARLTAVDHPSRVRVFPDERFATAEPSPTQELLAFTDWHLPRKATTDHGTDVTDIVTQRDGRTVRDFAPRSWLGFAEDHALELDFRGVSMNPSRRLFLVLAGWTDYPYPESIFAAAQAGVPMEPPVLEARQPDGSWKPIANLGFPAGLPKVMTADVTGKWPADGRVRIRSNLRVYWDQVALAPLAGVLTEGQPGIEGAIVRHLDPLSAELAHRGFMREVPPSAPHSPVSYDENQTESVSVTTWSGHLTRTGSVTELVHKTDDRFVLCGPGDEVTLRFDANDLPTLPAGWQRTFILRTWGYCKDTAPYTATGGSVGPLPFRGMPKYPYGPDVSAPAVQAEYDRTWNTRSAGR